VKILTYSNAMTSVRSFLTNCLAVLVFASSTNSENSSFQHQAMKIKRV